MAFEDKRKTRRFDAELPVELNANGHAFRGRTRNVSLGGAKVAVEVDPAPKIGDRIGVRLQLPTLEQPIEVQAEVRWLGGQVPPVLGLQFVTGLRAKETWALQRYLDALPTPS